MANLREIQKLHTRRLLLDKGLELFGEKGYAATTIDDIATAAGTTRTTFYLHFTSKSQLMQSLITEVERILDEHDDPPLATVAERGERALIRSYLARKFGQLVQVRPYLVAAYQAATLEPAIQAAVDAWFGLPTGQIEAGLARAGRFDPAARKARATLAFGQLEFLGRQWTQTGWEADEATFLRILTDSWEYLLTGGTADPNGSETAH